MFRRKSSPAEASGSDFFAEIGIRRRDDAHVDVPGARGADALEIAGFEHAQQLRLQIHRDVGDFVEKQRAAVGELETADAIGLRVGERAFDVAEELALENAFGKPACVHGDERPCPCGPTPSGAPGRPSLCPCRSRP